MKVIWIILVLLGVSLAAGGVYFIIDPPPGDGVVPYIPAAMMFFFAILTLALWGPMARSVGHGKLLRTGEPATATIVEIADTMSTINQQPVFRFTLDVHNADGSTHRTTNKQIVSRTALGMLRPGLVVPVRMDRRNPDKVAIDSSANIEIPAMPPAGGFSPMPPAGGTPPIAGVVRGSDVLRDGIKTTATIQSVSLMNTTLGQLQPDLADESNADDPMVMMALDVTASDGTSFAAQGIYRVPAGRLDRLDPGATLPVAYLARDPNNSTSVDWDRL